jgi:hypothetical protein
MARIRTIKPSHVNDKELAKISLQAHLLWVLSWCFSDDEGVIENDPLLLKSQIFPRRTDVRVEQIQQWIDQLIQARFMIPFTHNGEGYLIHRTFQTHQKIDRPQESKIPQDVIRRTLDECSTNTRPCIVKESIVKESKGKESASPPVEIIFPFDEDFKTSWQNWKDYKRMEHKFQYKSPQSEQAALEDLVKKSGGKKEIAELIIQQSVSSGWKGFFELKNQSNGKKNWGSPTKAAHEDSAYAGGL